MYLLACINSLRHDTPHNREHLRFPQNEFDFLIARKVHNTMPSGFSRCPIPSFVSDSLKWTLLPLLGYYRLYDASGAVPVKSANTFPGAIDSNFGHISSSSAAAPTVPAILQAIGAAEGYLSNLTSTVSPTEFRSAPDTCSFGSTPDNAIHIVFAGIVDKGNTFMNILLFIYQLCGNRCQRIRL